MKIYLTARELLDAGLWMVYCDASGTNEWAINEGRMDVEESLLIPEIMYIDVQVLIQRKIDDTY